MGVSKPFTIEDIKNSAVSALNAHLFTEPDKKEKKRSKYNNKKNEWNGMRFDSAKEYRRYRELLLLLKAGKIGMLERQVPFDLGVCKYIADHVYIETETGQRIVEDVKGMRTDVYILKRKLMLERLGITIKEI